MRPRIKKAGDSETATEPNEGAWVFKRGRRNEQPRGGDLRFRLDVVAPTVADVVGCVGGWLVDRAMLGWDITILIAQSRQDFRPLHILGANAVALDSVLAGRTRLPMCDAVSASAELYFGDARVRRHVLRRLDWRLSEFTLWGDGFTTEPFWCVAPSKAPVVVEHQLSLAARSFKAHAVAAADSSAGAAVGPTETFCDGRLRKGFLQSPLRVAQAVPDVTAQLAPDAAPRIAPTMTRAD